MPLLMEKEKGADRQAEKKRHETCLGPVWQTAVSLPPLQRKKEKEKEKKKAPLLSSEKRRQGKRRKKKTRQAGRQAGKCLLLSVPIH